MSKIIPLPKLTFEQKLFSVQIKLMVSQKLLSGIAAPKNESQDRRWYHKDRKAAKCIFYFQHKHKYVQTHQFYDDKNIFVQYLLHVALADDLWPGLSEVSGYWWLVFSWAQDMRMMTAELSANQRTSRVRLANQRRQI